MGTFQRPNRFFLLVIVSLSTVLAACSSGGGGNSGSAPNPSDTRPDPFTLSAPSSVDPEKVSFDTGIESAPVSITGIDAAAPVTINAGEYAINDGEFTSSPGTVRNGQQIRVRVQSPVKAEQAATTTLNIGGETATFTVTTGPDTIPPEVAILFPPPASMTEGATLFMRGTVKDANGTLEAGAVTVNGVEAELELNEASDEGTWSVTVDLEPGDNTVPVVVWDAAGNRNDADEASVPQISARRVGSIEGQSFPDNSVPFMGPISLGIHEIDGNPVALVTDRPALAVIAVDLNTGERSVFSSNETQMDNPFEYPWNIHVGANGKTYVFDWVIEQPRIYELDSAGTRELFIEGDESEESIIQPFGMYFRGSANGEYLYLADRGRVLRVNTETKNTVVLSDSVNGVPNSDNPIEDAVGMVFDGSSEQLLVISIGSQRLYFVDPQTGVRTVIAIDEPLNVSQGALLADGKSFLSVETIEDRVSIIDLVTGSVNTIVEPGVDEVNTFAEPRGVVMHISGEYALIVDRALNAIVALDLQSSQKVLLSKSE
jgi:hypothetical protein